MSSRPRDGPSLRGTETSAPGKLLKHKSLHRSHCKAPTLSRTPSTNTITQSRANTQQPTVRTQSLRSAQRPVLSSPRPEERETVPAVAPQSPSRDSPGSPPGALDSSSSSSSSLSDVDHPAHRSQLFKRPPRFTKQLPRDLPTFEEGDGAQENDDSGSHGSPTLPFASAARRAPNTKYAQDTQFRAGRPEQKSIRSQSSRATPPVRKASLDQQSQATTETASSMTTSASESDAPVSTAVAKSPMSPPFNHRAELGRLGSPRQKGPRSRKEGSEGTPSMGSSFSDIDDAGISQSALEEALLSNMQHGRMSTLSRMSRYL